MGSLAYPVEMVLGKDRHGCWLEVPDRADSRPVRVVFNPETGDADLVGLSVRDAAMLGEVLTACLDAHGALARVGLCDPGGHGLMPHEVPRPRGMRTLLHNEHTRRGAYMSFEYMGAECPPPVGVHTAWTHTGWGWFAPAADPRVFGTPFAQPVRSVWRDGVSYADGWTVRHVGMEDYTAGHSAVWFEVDRQAALCTYVAGMTADAVLGVRASGPDRDEMELEREFFSYQHMLYEAAAAWSAGDDLSQRMLNNVLADARRATGIVSAGTVTDTWLDEHRGARDMVKTKHAGRRVMFAKRLGPVQRRRLIEQFTVILRKRKTANQPQVLALLDSAGTVVGMFISNRPEHAKRFPGAYGFEDGWQLGA